MTSHRRALAVFCFVAALPAGAAAQPQASHGVELRAVPPKAGATFDVPIVGPEAGIANVRAALDLLIAKSPLSAGAIETLKRAGRVALVYDPNYPGRELLGYTVAAFYPKAFDERGTFLVRIGRHGVKWPAADLAAVLAHELVGHGMQRLRGDGARMRPLDRECEAWLYQEQAYQDLDADKSTKSMVDFRKQLEERECSDFKRHQAAAAPDTLTLWEARNPDVPRLLALFRDYLPR